MPKKKEPNPAQPLLDTSLKALYAAAGLTEVLTERFKEYADTYQENARSRRAKALEQINQATERAHEQINQATKQAQEMVRQTQERALSAPSFARNLPDQVQAQVEELLQDLNLTFEDMVRRGEARLSTFGFGSGDLGRQDDEDDDFVDDDLIDEGDGFDNEDVEDVDGDEVAVVDPAGEGRPVTAADATTDAQAAAAEPAQTDEPDKS